MSEGVLQSVFHRRLASLALQLHELMSPEQVLERVSAAAVELIPAVEYASVTVIGTRHRDRNAGLESVAPTGPVANQIDDIHQQFGRGPCFDAVWQRQPVLVVDVAADERWPQVMAAVCEQTPVRSILSVQLLVERELGALNVYADHADAFDAAATEAVVVAAVHAAIALSGARRRHQYDSALASRDLIGQTKGMLMERYSVDDVQAFALLQKLSQDSNVRLVDICTQLLDAEHRSPGGEQSHS